MNRHLRILGFLFWVFAALQTASLIVALTRIIERPVPSLFWAVAIGMIAAYAWCGWMIRKNAPRARTLAIALCALALLAFPLGTIMGLYGFYALWADRRATRRTQQVEPDPFGRERHA